MKIEDDIFHFMNNRIDVLSCKIDQLKQSLDHDIREYRKGLWAGNVFLLSVSSYFVCKFIMLFLA